MKINVKSGDFERLEKLELTIASRLQDLQLKYAASASVVDPEDAGETYALTEILGLIEEMRYGE